MRILPHPELTRAKLHLEDFQARFNSQGHVRDELPDERSRLAYDEIAKAIQEGCEERHSAKAVWHKCDLARRLSAFLASPAQLEGIAATRAAGIATGSLGADSREGRRLLAAFRALEERSRELAAKRPEDPQLHEALRDLRDRVADASGRMDDLMHRSAERVEGKARLKRFVALLTWGVLIAFAVVAQVASRLAAVFGIAGLAGAALARGRHQAREGELERRMLVPVWDHVFYLGAGGMLGLLAVAATRAGLLLSGPLGLLGDAQWYGELAVAAIAGFAPLLIVRFLSRPTDDAN